MLVSLRDIIDLDILGNALNQLCSCLILALLPVPIGVRSRVLPCLRELHEWVGPIRGLKGRR